MTIVRNLRLLHFLALDLVRCMQSVSMLFKSIMVETNNNKTSYLRFRYSQIESNPMKIVHRCHKSPKPNDLLPDLSYHGLGTRREKWSSFSRRKAKVFLKSRR